MKLQKPILIMLWILFMLLIIHNSHRIIRIVNENFSVHEQFQTTEFEGNSSFSEPTIDPTNYSESTIDPTNYSETTIDPMNESTVDPDSEVTEGPTNYTTEGPLTTVNYRPKKIQMIALRRKYNAPGYLIIIKNSQDQRLHIVRSRHKIPKSININRVEEKINVTFDNGDDDDTDVISFELIRQLYYNNIEDTNEGPRVTEGQRVTTQGTRVTTEGPRATTEGLRVTTEGTRATEGLRVTTEGHRYTTPGQSVTEGPRVTEGQRVTEGPRVTEGQRYTTPGQSVTEGPRVTEGHRYTTPGQSVTEGPRVTTEHFQSEVSNDEDQLKIHLEDFIIPTGENGLDYYYNGIDYTIKGLDIAVYSKEDIQGADDSLETFFGLEEPTITTSPVPAIKCMDEEIRSGHKHCVIANTLSLNKNVHSAWRDDNKCVKIGNNEPCFHCPAGTYIDYDNFNSVCSKCPYGTASVKANSFECTPMGGQTTTTTQLFPKQPIGDNLQDALNSLGQRNNEKFKKFESLQGRLERCKDKFDSFREYSIQ